MQHGRALRPCRAISFRDVSGGRSLLAVQYGVRFWMAAALAVVAVWSFAFGALALFIWVMDGMDPGTRESALTWKVPFAIGVLALSPSIWLYLAWCGRVTRTFFSAPEPITLDRGW